MSKTGKMWNCGPVRAMRALTAARFRAWSRGAAAVWLPLAWLPVASLATVHPAASLDWDTVNAAVSNALPGDVVTLPAGTATWSNTITSYGVSIIGAGRDVTIIKDAATNGNANAAWRALIHVFAGDSMTLTPWQGSNVYVYNVCTRISDLTLSGDTNYPFNNNYPTGRVMVNENYQLSPTSINTSNVVAIERVHFDRLTDMAVEFAGSACGLVRDCYFDQYAPGVHVMGNPLWTYGDATWSRPLELGTANAVVVENCVFARNPIAAGTTYCMDGWAGARMVFRYNCVTNEGWSCHGTETSGRFRSARMFECYNNIFVGLTTYAYDAFDVRGGSGVIYSNQVSGYQVAATWRAVYDRMGDPFAPWGGVTGTNAWDNNGPVVLPWTNAATTTGMVTVAGANWTPNQWYGYTVHDTSVPDSPSNDIASMVVTNDAHTLTFALARTGEDGSGYYVFTNGHVLCMALAYPCLDQPAAGMGDLIAGDTPVDTVYGTAHWPNQIIEGIYYWGNSVPGASGENSLFASSAPNVQLGRDAFNMVKPGYTALAYPHPLATVASTNGNNGGSSTNGGTSAGAPLVVAKWCVGGNVGWDATTNWSTVNTNSTPNPVTVPGATDLAVFNIDLQNAATVSMNAPQAASGVVFRATGTTTLTGGSLTLGSGGMRVVSGAGTVGDDGGGSLALTLSSDQNWMGQSGSTVLLQATGVNGGGKSLTLVRSDVQLGVPQAWKPNAVTAAFANMSNIILAEGAELDVFNSSQQMPWVNNDRIGDAADIISYGGALSYPWPIQTQVPPRSETVHSIQLVKGAFTHQQDGYPWNVCSNIFTYANGLNRTGPTATLIFSDVNSMLGNTSTASGAANRVILAGQARTPMLGPWAIFAGHGFAAYDPTIDPGSGCAIGVYGNAGANLWTTGWGGTDVNDLNGVYNCPAGYPTLQAYGNVTVGALRYNWTGNSSLELLSDYGTFALTIASGGLSFETLQTGVCNKISGGTVTAGTGSDANLFVFVTRSGANNERIIDSTIVDNGSGKVGLIKSGAYALTLTHANTYSGNTTINDGTLYLATAGSIANSPTIEMLYGNVAGQYFAGQAASGARLDVSDQTSTWTLRSNQTLKGNGTVIGNVNVNGTVAPGASTGMLTVNGNVIFTNNATLQINVQNGQNAGDVWGAGDTWNAGYGRLQVYGNVNLGTNAILDLELLRGASLANGDKLFIVTGASALSGQFKTASGTVLNPGATFTVNGKSYLISYTGNRATQAITGGNDVVLQMQALAPPVATLIMWQ